MLYFTYLQVEVLQSVTIFVAYFYATLSEIWKHLYFLRYILIAFLFKIEAKGLKIKVLNFFSGERL